MNEIFFEELQKENCWFTFSMFEQLPVVDPAEYLMSKNVWDNDILFQRHIFAMIFGSFGYSQNLKRAKRACGLKIIEIERKEPENKSFDNDEFITWLNLFAQYNVLYGTILAYQHDYVRSARFLMNGLKTGAINLFMPYCDFIRYVLSRLETMPAEIAEYEGCGFSVDEPMGGQDLNGGFLISNVAEMVIPALEGENGGIILAYNGRTRYGNLRRYSTKSEKFRNCVDVYEVLMIDAHGNLKKLRLYFNGYFSAENRGVIRLPQGFKIDRCNPVSRYYKFVK